MGINEAFKWLNKFLKFFGEDFDKWIKEEEEML